MDRYRASGPGARASTSTAGPTKRRRVETFEPLNAHDRLQQMHALRQFYDRGSRMPARPKSKNDLDVLKERHQFVRDSNVDPATLSWEDQLASKFYDSLFKECAVVNLKHYKTGAIALRWRTEDEVLAGIGHLTCGSLRCQYHEPSPAILDALAEQADLAASTSTALPPDPESETPLVDTRLDELEMPFGYVEDGEKKTALVKVVLCRECAKKLKYGREKAREEREKRALAAAAPHAGESAAEEQSRRVRSGSSRSESDRRRCEPKTRSPDRRSTSRGSRHTNPDDHEDEYRPELPPDLAGRGHSGGRIHGQHSQRRRSASPRR